ncbi:STAS domain-containing protein [Verrucomicrobiaceae bacterium N1E253]|uniref:Anti-sigma factor antagonist n=1 Tax=Oceaniferula marina TaxID=2748318 RepID=A0A851GNT0_9BACT|nr:STAS domain-containing protein [Oceaniferula marina]NWK56785.1 STAS domain-containing protein [Oceaniferula marina]
MKINVSQQEDITIVSPVARWDSANADQAEELLQKTLDSGANKVIIDFTDTTFVCSSGLRTLLITQQSLQKSKGKFALCVANEVIINILSNSGFLPTMAHFDTLEEACNYIKSS